MSEYLYKEDWILPGERASQGICPLPTSASFSSYPLPSLGHGVSISVSNQVCECVGEEYWILNSYYIPIPPNFRVPTARETTRGLAGAGVRQFSAERTET